VLLAISAILSKMATNAAVANGTTQSTELSNYVNTIASQLENAGAITTAYNTAMRLAATQIDLAAVRSNVQTYYATRGTTIVAPKFEEWVDKDASGILPRRLVPVTGLSFTNITGVEPGQLIRSNAFTVAGLGAGVTVPVEASAGTKIIKNGVAITGISTTAIDGDTIALEVTSLGYALSNTATVYVGSTSAVWLVTTKPLTGTISGLTSSGLVLQNNGGDNITITANATSFSFPASIVNGSSYNVTVLTQPNPLLSCAISNSSGRVGSGVSNISISCQVITQLVAGVSPTSLAVDVNNVYWSDSVQWSALTSSVNKIPLNGGVVTNLASNIAYTSSLAISNSQVFWTTNGGVYSVAIVGGVTTNLAAGYNTPIVVDVSNVYIAYSPNNVQSIATSTGTVTVLATDPAAGAAPYAIAQDSTNIYWSNWGGTLNKVSKNGGAKTLLFASSVPASSLAVDSTNVYWSDYLGIHKIPLNGGVATTIASGINPVYILVDTASSNIYWASSTSIGKVSVNGGAITTLVTSPTPSFVTNGSVGSNCIAVDSTSLYWGSATGLYKMAK